MPVPNTSSSFEIPGFLLVGKGLFIDLVVDIVDEAHDSFSLSDAFSKFSKSACQLSSASTC